MLCPKFSFLGLTVFKLLCSVSQSASVYSCTSTRKQRKIHIWNIQLHVNKVGYVGRLQKSEALTESWPPYFTHYCFYEVMHSVSLQVLKEDDLHSIDALFLHKSF